MDSTLETDWTDVVLPSSVAREHYRSRGSSYRMLSLRSASRAFKRSRLYRSKTSKASRGFINTRSLGRRSLRGRGIDYRRGLSIRSLGHAAKAQDNRHRYSMNQLNIEHLTRDLHDERLTCMASNNNVTAPTTAHATITMNCEWWMTFDYNFDLNKSALCVIIFERKIVMSAYEFSFIGL